MIKELANISLMHGWLPTGLFSLTGLCLIILLFTGSKSTKITGKRHPYFIALLIQLGAALLALLIGGVIVWLISDVFLVFGVSLGALVMISIAIGFGLLGFTIASAIMARPLKRTLAIITTILILLSTALRVDMVYGEYTTIGSIFGMNSFPKLKSFAPKNRQISIQQWYRMAQKASLPKLASQGVTRSVTIPSHNSHFQARTAIVYLPPAALVKNPPQLPIMIMLAGQPGSPSRFFNASDIVALLNKYAHEHHGLAPIVLSPDQNGATTHNSLCANTPVYGNAETYLTKDVPDWVRTHLPVSKDPKMWMMGGFSQGGTCATQLVPAYPKIFGSIFSAGGELAPTYKNRQETIARYFHGDSQRYEQHVPATIMRRNAPLRQSYYAVAGAWDPKSQSNQATIAQAAHKAGMNVLTMLAPTSGHDWHTVQAGLRVAFDHFCYQTGLSKTLPPLSSYRNVRIINNRQVNRD